jgi:hypothetical protein
MTTQTLTSRTLDIFNSDSNNKSADYIALCNELIADAIDTDNTTGNPLVSKIVAEMQQLNNNQPDCEYVAYTNSNSIEVWYNSIEECF